MTNENGLAVIEHVNGTSLEMYQDRNEVRELTDRLLSLHPAASEVGKPGMIAVAQLALLVGASPLPGTNEIHVWKSGNKIQFQLGINFYRRKADEQGGVLWAIQPRQMRDDERAEYGVPQGQIAAICKAVRRQDMEKYVGMGFKPNQIWDMVGRVGIGTAGGNEGKAGRTAVWTALKRSEVDLYRSLYPALMQGIEDAQRGGDVTISKGPDWNEITSEEIDDMFSYSTSATAPATAVEYIDLDTGEIEEADYEEIDLVPDDEPTIDGTERDPKFWLGQATEATSLDALAQALYKLHEPSGVFKDAPEAKGLVIRICGKDARNEHVIPSIGKYVQSVADGTAKGTAVKAAENHYLKLVG